LRELHEHDIDFRMLMTFKNALFDSDELEDNHLVPIEVWNRVLDYEFQGKLGHINDLILKEI